MTDIPARLRELADDWDETNDAPMLASKMSRLGADLIDTQRLEIDRLTAENERLRNDLQELTCGDARYTQLGQENERLMAALTGWSSYAWKNGVYIDDVQTYFDAVLKGTDPKDGMCKHDDGDCHADDPCENCPVYPTPRT